VAVQAVENFQTTQSDLRYRVTPNFSSSCWGQSQFRSEIVSAETTRPELGSDPKHSAWDLTQAYTFTAPPALQRHFRSLRSRALLGRVQRKRSAATSRILRGPSALQPRARPAPAVKPLAASTGPVPREVAAAFHGKVITSGDRCPGCAPSAPRRSTRRVVPHRQRGPLVEQAPARRQELQVVVQLGHRADSGARRPNRVGSGRWRSPRTPSTRSTAGLSIRSRNWRA